MFNKTTERTKFFGQILGAASLTVASLLLSFPSVAELDVPNSVEQAVADAGTIVDTAAASESFEVLTAAIEAAGLVETLQAEGPFTVFAPTDEAFAALPEGTLEELLKPENQELLVKVLTYHVVPGSIMSTDLESGAVATVEGNSIAIELAPEGVMVNQANVVQADVVASNGVIHVIDKVILPPNL